MSRTHRHPVMLIVLAWLGLAFAATVAPHAQGKAELAFKAALDKEVVDGDLEAAIGMYRKIAQGSDRAVAARALVRMGQCYEKLGGLQASEARRAYEQVMREFGDQTATAAEARARLAALAGSTGVARRTALAVRQVWAGPDVDIGGGLSPDGRYISRFDWSSGDLAVRDLVTGETRRVTKNGQWPVREFADLSVFSPDGRQLAYAWYTEKGTYDLRIIGIDGTGLRVLNRDEGFSYVMPFQWSNDGRLILSYVSRLQKPGMALALVSASDGSVRVLKGLEWRLPHGVSLSPDGRWVAYDSPHGEDPTQYDICLLATDGSRDGPLVEHPSSDTHPIWTPDGRRVLFVSDRGGTLGLWSVPVLDGQAQGEPDLVKPDVGRIVPFRITNAGVLYHGLIAGTGEVYEIRIDPQTRRLTSAPSVAFTHYVGFNGTPDYSPDGQFLAGISLRGSTTMLIPGNRSLVVRSLKTGDEREIRLNFAPGWELKWSPDSRFVLIPGRDMRGGINSYRVDVRTGEQTPVGTTIGVMTNQHGSQRGWFPDQRTIYLVARAPQDGQGRPQRRIVREDLASQKTDDLFLFRSDAVELRSVVLSPDGRQFAAWRRNLDASSVTLVLIPVAGGAPRDLVPMGDDAASELSTALRGLVWTPDGRYLLYTRRSAPKSHASNLWRVAVAGGQPENLGPLPDDVFDVVVHPSGDRIAISTRKMKAEVWLMENFLPVEKAAK